MRNKKTGDEIFQLDYQGVKKEKPEAVKPRVGESRSGPGLCLETLDLDYIAHATPGEVVRLVHDPLVFVAARKNLRHVVWREPSGLSHSSNVSETELTIGPRDLLRVRKDLVLSRAIVCFAHNNLFSFIVCYLGNIGIIGGFAKYIFLVGNFFTSKYSSTQVLSRYAPLVI